MRELAIASPSSTSFQQAVWLWTALGRLGGFRMQEFAMDKHDTIGYYFTPAGNRVARAFTLKNFIFYSNSDVVVTWNEALRAPDSVARIATEYDIQKNRVNGQLITFSREDRYPDFCPVRLALSIVQLAIDLGASRPTDPLCLYKNNNGIIQYLTGESITQYYRYVTRLVFPAVSDADLALVSTHSIRVTACVLLHEAGMDASYIKLRLRWKSNCFEVYLRNAPRIQAQHNEALSHANMALLQALTDITRNIPSLSLT